MAEIYVQVEVAKVDHWDFQKRAVGPFPYNQIEMTASFEAPPTLGTKLSAMAMLNAPFEIYWQRRDGMYCMAALVTSVLYVEHSLDIKTLATGAFRIECTVTDVEVIPG